MTNNRYTMTAIASCCGFTGTLANIELHDCTIQESGGRCEDYPCCGHTDGDGCQTLASHTKEYWTDGPGRAHLMCDHEAGVCDAYDDEEEEPEPDDEDDEPTHLMEGDAFYASYNPSSGQYDPIY